MKISRIIICIFSATIVVFSLVVFLPRSYNVPHMTKRESTRYWDLPTGSRIAYTLAPAKGEKKPYPIIFLQGGPGGHVADRSIEMLSHFSKDGYDVYLYDQIGCGYSGRLDDINDYTADRHKRDLEEIVKKIGAGKVILIGQSWGAILATLYIADNPEKVEKIVFTGPGPIQPMNRMTENINAPDSLHLKAPPFSNADANARTQNTRTRLMAAWARTFGRRLGSDAEADDFQTYLNNELNKATVCDTAHALKATAGDGFYAQIMTVRSFSETKDPRDKLKDLKTPVLIMKGQCDNQKWGFTNEYLQLFVNHQLSVIPDAGHSISIEQPELYLKTIRNFLAK